MGPFYPADGLIAWPGITKEMLHDRAVMNTVIVCKTQEGQYVYPLWQFQDDGTLIPGLRDVLKVLATGIKDGSSWALWLTNEVPGWLDGRSAMKRLAEGRDPIMVAHYARRDGQVWSQ